MGTPSANDSIAVIKMAKRSAARQRRKALAEAFPQADWQMARIGLFGLKDLFADKEDRVAAFYRPIGSELNPGPLAQSLKMFGWKLALPVTPPKDSDLPLTFRGWTEELVLEESRFGIEEPGADAPELVPDLILMPMLAFSRTGARLGYGQGHFDRTLEALRQQKAVIAVGLAYAGQEDPDLPVENHDQPLNAIITEAEFIYVDIEQQA